MHCTEERRGRERGGDSNGQQSQVSNNHNFPGKPFFYRETLILCSTERSVRLMTGDASVHRAANKARDTVSLDLGSGMNSSVLGSSSLMWHQFSHLFHQSLTGRTSKPLGHCSSFGCGAGALREARPAQRFLLGEAKTSLTKPGSG